MSTTIDPELFVKRPTAPPVHLNVRITGEDADIYNKLSARTKGVKESARVRDSLRLALFILALRENGSPVMCAPAGGQSVEVLEYLGVFTK